ncbi:MAG: phospho-N-acetylmuramoyl-pentapeptide-transferase [Clostridiales bacterium]|nr:phospho-N-acetylmuramoyl-pentapeptide-transferase [Clostridiales bacterium]
MLLKLQVTTQIYVFAAVFFLSLLSGVLMIPVLRKLKFQQTVREDGPSVHLLKSGTPIMGGLIFILPINIAAFFLDRDYPGIFPLALAMTGFGAVGFADDYIKAVKKRKDGLYPRQKMALLLLISTIFTFYALFVMKTSTVIYLPLKGIVQGVTLPLVFLIPLNIFVLVYATNSVNMTDGVDGLASSMTLIIAVFFAIVALFKGEWDFTRLFFTAIAGGCLAFLVFNKHPAKIFMGDTGSQALGGALAAAVIVMGLQWMIFVAGLVYFAESLSVIIQVGYYKLTRKRFFKMAPLHHHFELSGWKETKVVGVFSVVTIIMCIVAFLLMGL